MRKILLITIILLICITGCKKDPNQALVDKMVKDAKDAGIPVDRAEIEKMARASQELSKNPGCDFGIFLKAISEQDYEKAYGYLDDNLKSYWAIDKFTSDINQLFTDIGDKFKPEQMEFMNYPQQAEPVCTASYQLTEEFDSPFTMQMVARGAASDYKITQLVINIPYEGDDIDDIKARTMTLLTAIQGLDLDGVKNISGDEVKDQLQLAHLQQIKGILWDDTNTEKSLGGVSRCFSNGSTYCLLHAASQVHPMMHLEIFIDHRMTGIEVIGFRFNGRMRMN